MYAIGEIVLVVIGILIALQINNLNQSRQNQKLELEYLKGITININDDILELENLFRRDTINFDGYTFLVSALNSSDFSSKKSEVARTIYTVASFRWFEGQNIVFEDLKSSGKLNLIQSDTIRHAIQKYYRFFEEVIKQESLNNAQIATFKDRYIKRLDISPLIESTFAQRWNSNTAPPSLAFMDAPEFDTTKQILIKNLSRVKELEYYSHKVRIKFYAQAESLKKLIEQYLNENK